MISEDDLLSSDVHFEPPLYKKGAKHFKVYLNGKRGALLKGRLKGIVLDLKKGLTGTRYPVVMVPPVLEYDNRPEYPLPEVPLPELTRETLKEHVLDAHRKESDRIRDSSRT